VAFSRVRGLTEGQAKEGIEPDDDWRPYFPPGRLRRYKPWKRRDRSDREIG
jgi:hypothetical protein